MVDIFSKEILAYSPVCVSYEFNRRKHTETLKTIWSSPHSEGEEITTIVQDAPADSSWLSLLDLDKSDAPSALDAIALLEQAFAKFDFLPQDESAYEDFLNLKFMIATPKTLQSLDACFSDVMALVKQAIDMKPGFFFIHQYFITCFQELYTFKIRMDRSKQSMNLTPSFYYILMRKIKSLRNNYDRAREYIQSVFIRPGELDIHISPERTADLYNLYSTTKNLSNFYQDTSSLLFESPFPVDEPEPLSWDGFLQENVQREIPANGVYLLGSFTQLLHIGIDRLLESQSVLKKCAMCGGYFKAKFNSTQTCCSRIYKDTATTCYEYASRKTYKTKLSEHPIHSAYQTAYNRLYGRIRRKAIPADTPLIESLKELRDSYFKKYESAADSKRDGILEQYIKKNQELLG